MTQMLSSWKEIAQFFGKGVRTVQRWEKTLGLPVHRPAGAPTNVVLARTSDLEAWMHRGSMSNSMADETKTVGSELTVFHTIAELEDVIVVLAHQMNARTSFANVSSTATERLKGLKVNIAHLARLANSSRAA